jgi:hypothetical protein
MADYSDAFSGGTPGATIVGSNWAGYRAAPGGFNHWVYATGGEAVEPDTDATSLGVRWTGGSVGAAQYSEITLAQDAVSGGSTCYHSVTARCSGAAGTAHCYQFTWTPGNWYISRVVNGTGTDLGAAISGAPSNLPSGAVLRIEVEDSGTTSTIRGYYDTALIGTRTYDHSGGALASGTPGFEAFNSGATLGRVGSWAGGDLGGGDTTPPTLSSPTGTGGLGVCSGSVSTNEGNGTLYAVATASATAPSAAQVKAGQDHTGSAALRVVSQSVTGTGTQTVASGAISGGAGTRYLHYMHEDAAANQSTVSSSAGFTITAALSVTLDALVDEDNNPRATYTVDKVFAIRLSDNTLVAVKTAQVTNGSGVLPAFSDAALTAAPHLFVTWDDNETPNNAGAKVYTPS